MVSVDRVIGKIDLLKLLIITVIKKESSKHPQKRSMPNFPGICKTHPGLCQPALQQLQKQQRKHGVSKQNGARARLRVCN